MTNHTGKFRLPPSEGFTLANGMRVLAMETRGLPLVDFDLIIGSGAAHDPPGREGLADLTADLLRKGTAKRTAFELADAVDFTGGVLGASADQDGTRVSAEFLSSDLDLGLDLLAEIAMGPAFAPDEVERLKGETISELKAVKENPGLIASRRFVNILFSGHPYGHPTPGWESSVAEITREDVRAFYESHYTPGTMILVGAGDFASAEFIAKAEKRFGGWRGSAAMPREVPEPTVRAGRTIYFMDKPDATQSQIRIGGIGLSRTDPQYTSANVANTILGGGFTSRLVEEIRVNRGLSYGVGSRFYPLVKGGAFLINTSTKNQTTRETVEVALDVLGRFRADGVTDEELDKAKRYLRGTFAIGHQTPEAMAESLADIAFYGLPSDYYDTYLDRVTAITKDDVARVAARFPYENLVVLVLGKAEEVLKDLEKVGPVTVLPLGVN